MIEIKNKQDCCGCTACAMICPKQCIIMKKDEEGFYYPNVEIEKCVNCDLCNRVCPITNEKCSEKESEPATYAMLCKDREVRRESSSGGIFSLLAKEVIRQGGVVLGVAMSDDYKSAKHIAVDSMNELYKLRGSKYIQSDVGNAFAVAEGCLKTGKTVLFTGTPCQIEGLKSFLRTDYENLFCMDIVCHGVPSEVVWREYIKYREGKAQSSVSGVSFRHKEFGWKSYSMLVEFENKKRYLDIFTSDLYARLFLQNLSLRPACYACSFKKINRVSDITVADFWGVENVVPEMDDDMGVSLVMVHSKKGQEILSKVCNETNKVQVEFNLIKKYNSAVIHSAKYNEKRGMFFKDLGNVSFDKLVKKYTVKDTSLKTELVNFLRKTHLYEGLRDAYRKFKSR